MADFTNSKGPTGAVFPDNAVTTPDNKVEPLITATQLRQRFLAGLPLHSQIKDPITGKIFQFTDQVLDDIIAGAVSQIETDTRLDIMPVQRYEKYPFDRQEFDSWGFFRLKHTPVASIQKLSIVPSNGIEIYEIPLEWIETANLIVGQVNIVPIGIGTVFQGLIGSTPSSGAWFLSTLLYTNFLPAFWQMNYTTGFPNGQLPRSVNEMIGCIAAIEVLGMLAATHARVNSSSLGIDGFSQSVSTPGPALFQTRIDQLQQKYDKLSKRFKGQYMQKIWSDQI